MRETAVEILSALVSGPRLDREVHSLIALASVRDWRAPAHRVLVYAVAESEKWSRTRDAARAMAIANA